MTCSSVSLSAFDVDDVDDMASGAKGFFGEAERAGAFAIGASGAAFADFGTGKGAGVAGVVCGVTLREIGRGFGNGTAEAVVAISASAVAPSIAVRKRRNPATRAGLTSEDEGANRVTGILWGESFECLHHWCSALNMWTKHQM